ncbi:DUF4333 domain-containing protein [Nocardioides sp. CGMCC 1.13656]|uniref:DUF4333 domain-containing protein n=1 Tax=Nocardioides TaxID=1839 RepID=UPI0012FCDF84|nr:DUF4333 domain-containing protein [Nocardioides sp. CGMCC 1.13656]MBA2954512.1 DUF4333 domain-containing protein [Nocardioides sp. CGMCC 1.13656]
MKTSRTLVVVAVTALATLAACGDSTLEVEQTDVEEQISSGVAEKAGTTPEVSCPGDLTGEVGEEMRCSATVGSDAYGVSVKVTDVDGKDVDFSWLVDEEPGDAPS